MSTQIQKCGNNTNLNQKLITDQNKSLSKGCQYVEGLIQIIKFYRSMECQER